MPGIYRVQDTPPNYAMHSPRLTRKACEVVCATAGAEDAAGGGEGGARMKAGVHAPVFEIEP
jgi:hypothetical protein